MDNMEDSEPNTKISDSAYSNSCSNSQSRRSHSSKSESHSSGSSGYGGKHSTSGSSNTLCQSEKKDKEIKKKKIEVITDVRPAVQTTGPPEPEPIFAAPQNRPNKAVEPTSTIALPKTVSENIAVSVPTHDGANKEMIVALKAPSCVENYMISLPISSDSSEGFSCVVSMHDGVIMCTTKSLTTTLGFPQEMWHGRSFIDFLHPKDQTTFATQITNRLALPTNEYSTDINISNKSLTETTIMCRLRRYRNLNKGFGVKEREVGFMPFILKFSFKNLIDDEDMVYLVIQAIPFHSAYKVPNEVITKPSSFVIRHDTKGILKYIGPESVPHLGYLPQDILDTDALLLYHADDLPYIRQIYESIIKDGKFSRCVAYRMMTQNGHFLKLETEWSAIVNPWSKKLEFIMGKHYVIEGPANPDIFQAPIKEVKPSKVSAEEKMKTMYFRKSILRVLNDMVTKSAVEKKQQIAKGRDGLTCTTGNFLEDSSKMEEEILSELQNPENSYFERDSVMLGGISPHHDYDGKSSTDTPLSYNQLNYNNNLQRYFDSHPHRYELKARSTADNNGEETTSELASSRCMSPMCESSLDSDELSSCGSISFTKHTSQFTESGEHHHVKLTETLLVKHNAAMEKELFHVHRETRSSSKRERASDVTRKKKKEHLARCNASFQPTLVGTLPSEKQAQAPSQGLKRSSKAQNTETNISKHRCATHRHHQRRPPYIDDAPAAPEAENNVSPNITKWPAASIGEMNTYILGVGLPHQMPMTSPMPMNRMASPMPMNRMASPMPMNRMPSMPGMCHMPGMTQLGGVNGMYPMFYTPTTTANVQRQPTPMQAIPSTSNAPYPTPMPYMMCGQHMCGQQMYGQPMCGQPMCGQPMYGQPMYGQHMYGQHMCGQPFAYPPMNTQASYPMQPPPHSGHIGQTSSSDKLNPLGLSQSNYEQACIHTPPLSPSQRAVWRETRRAETPTPKSKVYGIPFGNGLNRSTEAIQYSYQPQEVIEKSKNTSYEGQDRTDGESSYSSFYSSFLKTDSGSAEDSDQKKKETNVEKKRFWAKNNFEDDSMSFPSSTEGATHYFESVQKEVPRRKMQAPWMDKVNMTSELTYKYQVLTKSIDEVLKADKEKMKTMEQPSLVNDQLGQLYLDLQLRGFAARLTLEEGITSSSSSGEESNIVTKTRKKREYSKLVMIYEEDAPLPPPHATSESDENVQSGSN